MKTALSETRLVVRAISATSRPPICKSCLMRYTFSVRPRMVRSLRTILGRTLLPCLDVHGTPEGCRERQDTGVTFPGPIAPLIKRALLMVVARTTLIWAWCVWCVYK